MALARFATVAPFARRPAATAALPTTAARRCSRLLPWLLLVSTLLPVDLGDTTRDAVGMGWGVRSVRAEIRVAPAVVKLDRPEASQQLVITRRQGDRWLDVTREAQLEIQSAVPTDRTGIARVAAGGLVQPLADGRGSIMVRVSGEELRVPLEIQGIAVPEPVSFAYEIQPLLAKARCNSGGCHGKAEGQNGFKLSLLGFDDDADYEAIVKAARGRRVSLADPSGSLMLRKAAAIVPHGGGLKIEPESAGYQRLRRWIASGAPRTVPVERRITGIVVEPAQIVLEPNQTWQLRVVAQDESGVSRCVTAETDFVSNASGLVGVTGSGLLEAGEFPGDAAILVRYLGHVAVCRVIVPRAGTQVPRPTERNFIDKLVWNKLSELGIPASAEADDGVFLRRVYLDVIGTLPTAAEARAFLADQNPNKRAAVIDALLNRPEYADYWSMKWSNLLRSDKLKVTHQGTVGMTRWLHKQFAANRPYDEMAREILTAQGPVQSEGPVSLFKSLDQPEVASRSISQLFLGVRIECAQCHHHPSERWGQDDYAGLAGFFTGVSLKRLPDGTEAVVSRGGTDVKHPRTGVVVAARPLGAAAADFTAVTDRRQILAQWMTAPDNPFFARAIANRLWAHYFGRGLVEPIDDLRATNPATNEPLLDALAAHLRDQKYDLKALTRTMLNSRAYQLSSATTPENTSDQRHFSHVMPRALPAEVLLDAISQATGVPEKFAGWPLGVRAIEVWDNRMPSYFFRIFGRPVRASVCECERSNEPSISQALHLLNSPEINAKIAHRDGWARKLAESSLTPDQLIDEIYLGTVARFPTNDERAVLRANFTVADAAARRQSVEDALWAVLNTKEFLYAN
ncbi:MAG: DUF1549 and DUF1553 domain-containing protein [Planctomycetota bacterium]